MKRADSVDVVDKPVIATQRPALTIDQITAIQLAACEMIEPAQVAKDLGLKLPDVNYYYFDKLVPAAKDRPARARLGHEGAKRR